MSIDDKRYKELVVTIQMNGRKSARRRKISPPPKPDPNLKQTTKLLPPSPTKLCISNISPKIDNKGLKSPMRTPKLIQSMNKISLHKTFYQCSHIIYVHILTPSSF